MAVTNEYSTQYTDAAVDVPADNLMPNEWYGKLRLLRANFTQGSAAGDATSTALLVKVPAGARVIGHLSKLYFSAFGSSRTLDVGYAAHTNVLTGVTVVADPDAFCSAVDVSSAGSCVLDEAATAAAYKGIGLTGEAVILATVAGGTIPAAATLDLHLFYVLD